MNLLDKDSIEKLYKRANENCEFCNAPVCMIYIRDCENKEGNWSPPELCYIDFHCGARLDLVGDDTSRTDECYESEIKMLKAKLKVKK